MYKRSGNNRTTQVKLKTKQRKILKFNVIFKISENEKEPYSP
jgi:hypothetical protein